MGSAPLRLRRTLGPLLAELLQEVLEREFETGRVVDAVLGADDEIWGLRHSVSEGLLALPELQSLRGLPVGLVTAPGGRGLIGETLAHRGALVHLAEVYRREPLLPNASRTALIPALPDFYARYPLVRIDISVGDRQIDLIREGGGLVDIQAQTAKASFSWTDLGIVLSKHKLWGIYLGQFCLNSTLWFFLTWFPTYLVKYRGMDFIKSGLLASLPFLAAFVGVLCSGFFSDLLIRRGCSVGFARKLPIIGGLLISTSIIGANFVESTPLVIAFLALAFFGNGLASITWSLVSPMMRIRSCGFSDLICAMESITRSGAAPMMVPMDR